MVCNTALVNDSGTSSRRLVSCSKMHKRESAEENPERLLIFKSDNRHFSTSQMLLFFSQAVLADSKALFIGSKVVSDVRELVKG